jgi:hypothetical protein
MQLETDGANFHPSRPAQNFFCPPLNIWKTLPEFIIPSLLQQIQIRQMINIANRKCIASDELLFRQNLLVNLEYSSQLVTEWSDDFLIRDMAGIVDSTISEVGKGGTWKRRFP